MTDVLIRRGEDRDTHMGEDDVKTEAEIGAMCLQGKGCQDLSPKTRRAA